MTGGNKSAMMPPELRECVQGTVQASTHDAGNVKGAGNVA